jgi:hypothetical protein
MIGQWGGVGVRLHLVGKQDVTMCGEGKEKNWIKRTREKHT